MDKSLIGRLAAEEVEDGDTIFIDSGTTTLCLLRFLVAKKRITIITHSLGALSEASKYDNLNIISLGGIYSPTTDSSGFPPLKRSAECRSPRRSWARPAFR